jgi:hypothetical protein
MNDIEEDGSSVCIISNSNYHESGLDQRHALILTNPNLYLTKKSPN